MWARVAGMRTQGHVQPYSQDRCTHTCCKGSEWMETLACTIIASPIDCMHAAVSPMLRGVSADWSTRTLQAAWRGNVEVPGHVSPWPRELYMTGFVEDAHIAKEICLQEHGFSRFTSHANIQIHVVRMIKQHDSAYACFSHLQRRALRC
jgi:hypothetical protein